MATDILYDLINTGKGLAVASSLAQISLSEAENMVFKLFASREYDLLGRWSQQRSSKGTLREDATLNFLALLIQLRPEMTSACCEVLDYLYLKPDTWMRLLNARDHPILRIHAEHNLHIPSICRTSLSELQLAFFPDPKYRWNNWKSLEHIDRLLRL
ncbi:hypothetical protein B0H12DRAFT_541038 [Mycena haematopus]|nr:hypothetical protein B0H12DRAFT_541038 [Mycena haematopus]